jgi:MoxR-like ATPase
LQELDRMEFYVYELQRTIKATQRPIIIITSNNEKELPDAFLRRCFFYYITFPDPATMLEIVQVHFPNLSEELIDRAMHSFYNLRELKGLKKKPSTSELLDWIRLLNHANITPQDLEKADTAKDLPPYWGALLKNEQDYNIADKWRRMGR